jgi:asparagine synthase (glutamine-hydrolysing)
VGGIFGQLNLKTLNPVNTSVEVALNSMLHRGPDECGFWHGDGIHLGTCRLSMIDQVGGQQPMWNENLTSCIIYNGELFNFLELRQELESKGYIFRTSSDTEVVLCAYSEWGPDCLGLFNGMFAIAIWDEEQKTLFLARDRLGEKPLYYYQDGNRLVFASEIKAILTDNTIPRQLNLRGLANFLAFAHAIAPETIYQNIYKLLPGHYLIARNGHVQIHQYWDVGKAPQLPDGAILSENEYVDYILSLIEDSVRRRMIADVPVGAFLSGGLDSSAIVALMKRHAVSPIKTFSIGFKIGGRYNELSDARRIAEYLSLDHHELQVDHVDLIETLRTMVYHYDEPFGDPAAFPLYLLSRFARKHVKIVLTGDGPEFTFGGTKRYVADQVAPLYQKLPKVLINRWIPKTIGRLPRQRRVKSIVNTLPVTDPAQRGASWLTLFTPEMQAELLRPDIYEQLADYDPTLLYSQFYNHLDRPASVDHLNRLMYMELKTMLPDLLLEKWDKVTMACSLEARMPILDYRVVELAFQIPAHYKIRGWSSKYIFKRAVRSLVPPEILRKPKHGLYVPTDPWFRGDLKTFTFEVLLDEHTRQRGYFNMSTVERLWHEHIEGHHVWSTHLWLLLNFELWNRIYIDGESI